MISLYQTGCRYSMGKINNIMLIKTIRRENSVRSIAAAGSLNKSTICVLNVVQARML